MLCKSVWMSIKSFVKLCYSDMSASNKVYLILFRPAYKVQYLKFGDETVTKLGL